MPGFDKLRQVVFESPTLFSGVPLVSVIFAIQALVSFGCIPAHLVGPSKIRFMLYSLRDLMYQFFECYIYPLSSTIEVFSPYIYLRPWLETPESVLLLVLKSNKGLPLPLQSVLF